MCAAPFSGVSSAWQSRAFGTPRSQVQFLHLRPVTRSFADLAHLVEQLFCKQRVASSNLAVGSICAVTQSRTPAVATDRLRAGCDGAASCEGRAQAVMQSESLFACPRKATGTYFAPVVELADTPGLDPGAAGLPSSTLGGRTTTRPFRIFLVVRRYRERPVPRN
jgi:hypothetical protein